MHHPQDDPNFDPLLGSPVDLDHQIKVLQEKLFEVEIHAKARLTLLQDSGFADYLPEVPSLQSILKLIKKWT